MRTHSEITTKARSTKSVITRGEYAVLLRRLEDVEDSLDLLRAQDQAVDGDAWPDILVQRMLKGEHRLRLWREHRGLTLDALSRGAKVAPGYLSEIESGKKPGSVATLKKCAAVLRVDLDDLV